MFAENLGCHVQAFAGNTPPLSDFDCSKLAAVWLVLCGTLPAMAQLTYIGVYSTEQGAALEAVSASHAHVVLGTLSH